MDQKRNDFLKVQLRYLCKLKHPRHKDNIYIFAGLWIRMRSGLDPDSVTLGIRIRIRIGNPDPDPGARK
jgi:hypothetical protein